jgi:hypothetical protein
MQVLPLNINVLVLMFLIGVTKDTTFGESDMGNGACAPSKNRKKLTSILKETFIYLHKYTILYPKMLLLYTI